ncbi:lysosomal acid lipase/cholesteryl ester hydrolase [Tetranychus urticae]|uniref:Lipase n=1 Tax=Tetranychus urticae TaxID=32264 RepID=T1L283_TETUR|nr:lysosomal acid lipase/cholesteryl ester hydrolase [Tetranychus urticae]
MTLLLIVISFIGVLHGSVHATQNSSDVGLTIGDLITSRGFIHEPHYVTTRDGYILGIHRMINPLSRKYIAGKPKPIILQCGLLCSGSEFLDNSDSGYLNETMIAYRHVLNMIDFESEGNNLGFLLANLGFDVWFFHPRGNMYSRNHTTLDPDSDKSYWQFTWDQMALIDLPATFELIMNQTEQTVGYIGYSQGGTTIFGLLSEWPEYSANVVPIINIAPAVRLDNYAGLPYQSILESPLVMNYVMNRGGECFGRQQFSFCEESPIMKIVCNFVTFNLLSINKNQVDPDRIPVFMSHIPSGTSCWDILHLVQLIKNKNFAKFDFGKTKNLIKYNSTSPPLYDLGKVVTNDLYLVHSIGDHSADPADITLLKSLLTSVPTIYDHVIQEKTFDHLDYFMSKNIGTLVNGPIARMLDKYNP